VYPFSQRRGKVTVLNELVARSTQPILIFSDANTEFDGRAIRRLVRHFRAPQVGVVCGELVLTAHGNDKNDDHTYWRYESWLKSRESSVGGLLGANGGIYAMRREAFVPPPGDTIVDDFVIAMAAYRRGFRLLYDQEALAYEEVAPDLRGEFRRRVRIGIGNYQALRTLFHLLSPLRGMLFFTYLSHKVMRWFVPHLLLTALIASACLWADPLYRGVFLLQLAGYLWVAISYFLMRGISTPRIVRIPTYVVVLNAALLIGFGRFISGQYSAAWKRTDR
jgi:cellulose synthase/poly-beta-1,6-N-acetylglucosamine synthase-like glycosyltransferase